MANCCHPDKLDFPALSQLMIHMHRFAVKCEGHGSALEMQMSDWDKKRHSLEHYFKGFCERWMGGGQRGVAVFVCVCVCV